MSDGKGGFWTSLPGILTGVAALISALAGAGLLIAQSDGGSGETYGAVTSDLNPEVNSSAENSATDMALDAANGSLDSSQLDNSAVASEDSAGSGGAPADIAGGNVVVRPITVENACPKAVSIWLAYEAASGWTKSGGEPWQIAANEVIRPTYNGNLLNAKSPDVYYSTSSDDGTASKGDVSYDGLTGLLKTTMEIDQSGDYRIRLTCG